MFLLIGWGLNFVVIVMLFSVMSKLDAVLRAVQKTQRALNPAEPAAAAAPDAAQTP